MGETISIIIAIISVAFGVLQIILFFKVWGMCNNVSNIYRLLLSQYNEDDENDEKSNDELNNSNNDDEESRKRWENLIRIE